MNEFTPSPAARAMVAAQIEIGKRRKSILRDDDHIFGDPSWNMLLTLFAHENSPFIGLDELARELALPLSTTKRHLRILEARALIVPQNEGRSYALASRAVSMMESVAAA